MNTGTAGAAASCAAAAGVGTLPKLNVFFAGAGIDDAALAGATSSSEQIVGFAATSSALPPKLKVLLVGAVKTGAAAGAAAAGTATAALSKLDIVLDGELDASAAGNESTAVLVFVSAVSPKLNVREDGALKSAQLFAAGETEGGTVRSGSTPTPACCNIGVAPADVSPKSESSVTPPPPPTSSLGFCPGILAPISPPDSVPFWRQLPGSRADTDAGDSPRKFAPSLRVAVTAMV